MFILDVLPLQLVYYSCVVEPYNIKILVKIQIITEDSYQVLGLVDMCNEGSAVFASLKLIGQVR